MFRFGKVAWFSSGGFAPFMDAPDAGSGGGGADPVDGGGGTPPPAGGIDPTGDDLPAARATDDDEDDEDEDLRADAEVTPERWKRVTTKLSKLNRRDKAFRVERARLKDLRDQGVSLDDLIHGTRQHRELAAQIANNPALKKLVNGDVAEERLDPPAAKEEDDPDFDEKALPFDPDESPTNRYFADLAKANHELRRSAKTLEGRLNKMEGKDTARTAEEQKRAEVTERTSWKSAIDAAAATIEDETTRLLFKDALAGAYQNRTRHGKTPQQIIAHYLKGKVTSRQAAAATAAAGKATPATPVRTAATQQRIAESNKTLPRTVAPAGTPASARTGKESLADVRRRVTGRSR